MATPTTASRPGDAMFRRAKTFPETATSARPLLLASDVLDTDFEDESDFEDYSPKASFETDERRVSQTTISSYDEAPTPSSGQSRRPFELDLKPVEGPRGPHLFRSSQSSVDLAYEYALQMSPMLPKQPPPRTETAFSDETITPVTRQRQLDEDFSIAAALHKTINADDEDVDDPASIRQWSPQQVIDWMYVTGIDPTVIECFERHDVDGRILDGIQFEDLKELDIQSFGKRQRVWSAICDLRGDENPPSPQPTPFQDTSRPCTTTQRRSPSRSRSACQTPVEADADVTSPAGGKKRRGRKAAKQLDIITPAESISIVAIEQLLPKPHKCAKGERCAKWRKQQRELKQLHDENAIGRFPISPGKGGRVFVRGDPGNAATAENIVPNVRMQPTSTEEPLRPTSEAVPSVVASSDLLGPGQLPDFALLYSGMLDHLDHRDPQDNVRQFLNFQHFQSPAPPLDDAPRTPGDVFKTPRESLARAASVPPLFPEQHYQAYPSLHPKPQLPAPIQQLRHLPRLDIPTRSATAGPYLGAMDTTAVPESATSICRSTTASPFQMLSPSNIYRLGTPASEMDVPITAFPTGPIARDTSASVPPNMQYRPQHNLTRSASRAEHWRRPSMALPAVKENEVLSARPDSNPRPNPRRTVSDDSRSTPPTASPERQAIRDPAHHSPTTQHFGYGTDCSQAGWMKKRKTRLLRHEWTDAHFRLQGTSLGMYPNARLSSAATDTINVDDYAVACSTSVSNSKLAAAMKAFKIKQDDSSSSSAAKNKAGDATAFAFQLVPAGKEGEARRVLMAAGKTHHFAVRNKDERIDWMRELMLAKARQQKREGYEVEVNGVQA
ncbi:hypothetical protein LTS16_017892 [Friedmanniomyces endolithicus]|nr:hypothetical protein LTR94_006972 [Friedmanniomyces endolithicus]KAK0788068.1 hypothetical protein LTR59_010140 [Friedmanniomyces endolithicus]KAK0798301.1 hypothetical protein LTR75_009600 [Friedmanniomyces endolithicus]KAK0808806.1 hypothetical protein LTR38_004512 [Friedmanniomyces endolithicus]KAK0840850.1 hypothetical protein LTR03_010300 [Friedmanniomyces endolithicus]